MAFQPYTILFTDQNPNRQFVIQPFTTNGPATPTSGVDPSAANANTTLFLYGKGTPNYGERFQEDLLYILENFFNPNEPSFPIPGQMWCQSSANELTTPFQMFMFSPRKYRITGTSTNNIYVQSDDGSETAAQVLLRFQQLGLAKPFNVYSAAYQQTSFVQSAIPTIVGPNVVLTVNPAVPFGGLTGQYIGGWEEFYTGNAQVVLRRSLDANNNNIINLATPVNPNDAATKAYVDLAVTGGTLTLSDLADVQFQTPGFPQTGTFLYFNGSKWTDQNLGNLYLPLSGGTMAGVINMGGFKVTNVAAPTSAFDATNKAYVDTQPLSSVNVSITTPATGDLLYFTSGGIWQNAQPAVAGVVPLTGGVSITGSLSLSGNALTSIATPVNPTDAANKAYVDAAISGGGGGVVTSGTFNNTNGTLTLNISGGFPSVDVTGFIPLLGSFYNGFQTITDQQVTFTPENPSNLPTSTATGFFSNTLGDRSTLGVNSFEDPINVSLHAGLNQIDLALGNFTIPRQRFVFPADGTRTQFDINNGAGLSPLTPLNGKFVKGSNALAVYINGVKQIAATAALARITSFSVGATYTGANITTSGVVITGNVSRIFHRGVQFVVSNSLSQNNGAYVVTSSTYNGTTTLITAQPNTFASNPGNGFVASTGVTITYTVNALTGDMETGYVFTGTPSSAKTINVNVNGLGAITISIDPALTNVSSMALLCDAINKLAASTFINPIVGISGLNFIVAGNVATQFSTGTAFTVRYSTNNGTGDTGTPYSVAAPGAVYNSGTNQTSIPVASAPTASPADGVIFQDKWGFSCAIQNGFLVFHSNLPGAGSSIVVTDPGSGTGLLSSITGVTWPITFSSTVTSVGNAFAPADYAYKEIGLNGSLSSLFVFSTAPVATDVIEVVIDRDMVYNATNPLATATIA